MILEDLIFNMCRRTQWREAMVSVYQRGCSTAVELPPGYTLTALTKKRSEKAYRLVLTN